MRFKLIAAVLLAVLTIVVLVQNRQSVTFTFLFWKGVVPQLLLVAISLAVGFLGGVFTAWLSGRRT